MKRITIWLWIILGITGTLFECSDTSDLQLSDVCILVPIGTILGPIPWMLAGIEHFHPHLDPVVIHKRNR